VRCDARSRDEPRDDTHMKITAPSTGPTPEAGAPTGDEADLFIQRAVLAAIVESSDDAIVSKTLEGRILTWNAGATRIFGYGPDEAIGRPITLIVPPELHSEEEQILQQLRQGKRIDHFDTTRMTKDGRRIAISLTVSPIRDVNGRVIGASKVARDVSDRKRAEEIRRQSEQALREADRRKDEFLALLAHELRNPLAPIRYALAANKKAGQTREQRSQNDEIIERQVNHMSRLLDDLLDVSRIRHGTLELKKRAIELSSVVSAAIETARPALNAKHHHLSVAMPEPAIRLDADAVRLAQVFSNLLINAAKYTDPGGRIQLAVTREQDVAVICVRDNGIGLSADLLPRLFTIFSRERTTLGRAEGGLGVGLSLVRGITTLHGGTVEGRSEGPGKGSEFIVRLPIDTRVRAPAQAEPVPDPATPEAALEILVVDDNRDAADTCAMLLEAWGHHVRTAYLGREALELGQAFHPDAVLLDIGLPDIDGYALARQIRATPWGVRAVLVAVTGWGQEEDRLRAARAGFDQHLVKPIAGETIASLLHSLRARPNERESHLSTPTSGRN
jgi:PAS domain S-box-containing protein